MVPRLYMVLGGSGGPRIITATMQVLLNVISYGMNVAEAIYAPRVHNQLIPNRVTIDADFDPEIVQFLTDQGNEITQGSFILGCVQAIVIGDDNYLYAASDWRKQGAPAGF